MKLCAKCDSPVFSGGLCKYHSPKTALQKRTAKKGKKGNEHILNYHDFFGFKVGDDVPCEITGRIGVQYHHLIKRSKEDNDSPENVMAIIFAIHHVVEAVDPSINEELKRAHELYIVTGKPFYITDPEACLRLTKNYLT